MRPPERRQYSRHVIDFSFVLGVALGTIVTGFCAIGSYNRGFDSVRRRAWALELAARKRAVVGRPVEAVVVSVATPTRALRNAS
jgi:hypothetical protein